MIAKLYIVLKDVEKSILIINVKMSKNVILLTISNPILQEIKLLIKKNV